MLRQVATQVFRLRQWLFVTHSFSQRTSFLVRQPKLVPEFVGRIPKVVTKDLTVNRSADCWNFLKRKVRFGAGSADKATLWHADSKSIRNPGTAPAQRG